MEKSKGALRLEGGESPKDERDIDPYKIDPKLRRALRDRMVAWKNAGEKRNNVELLELIKVRFRKEEANPDAELDLKADTLRSFISRPETSRLGGHMSLAARALEENIHTDAIELARHKEARNPDGLFHALSTYLRAPELTSQALMRRLPGVYTVYRPILTHPACFVRGFLVVRADHQSGAISYREYNRINARFGREEKVLSMTGYALKKSAMIYLLGSDERRDGLQLTILTGQEKNEDDVYRVLSGGFIDHLGNQAYSGRVFMERNPRVKPSQSAQISSLEAESVMMTAEEIPPSVLAYFEARQDFGVNFF